MDEVLLNDWRHLRPITCMYEFLCPIKGLVTKLGCLLPRIFFFLRLLSHRGKKPLLDRGRRPSSPLSFSHPSHSSGLSEMLHIRLFQSQLTRPLARRVGVRAVPAASAGFGTGAADGYRSPGRGRTFAGWRAPTRLPRRPGGREFCTKGDGQNDAAKDTDKWVISSVIRVKRRPDLFLNGPIYCTD